MLGYVFFILASIGIKLTLRASGLTKPWAPIDYPIAVEVMRTALEQGANFWNGVSKAFE